MSFVATSRIAPAQPPKRDRRWWQLGQSVLFSSPASGLTSVAIFVGLTWLGWQLLRWGLLDAVFSTHGQGPALCRQSGAGACWAIVGEKFRLIVFGIYPYDQQWRPAIAMCILVTMYVLSTRPAWWNWRLILAWGIALGGFALLMWGGLVGLLYVPDDQWGGLPVTLILATLGLAAGFPLAVLLALLRNAQKPGVGKALAVAYIELARSVPLVAVLFLASVMVPLFLPQGVEMSKLLRIFIAFALFAAAYLAEVIRGGLVAIPRGQYEAADALGLSRRVTLLRVVLPQALTTVLPSLVNIFIAFFKATSIVVVVGIFDLMTAAKRAVADAQWQGFGTEIYLFVGAIYFVFCYAMSRYSARLHASLDVGRRN